MKIFFLLFVISQLSFAQLSSSSSSEKYDTTDKEVLKNIDTTLTIKNSAAWEVKDREGKTFTWYESKPELSYRMVYSDTLITIFKSEGYTATRYNLYIGKSVKECLEKFNSKKKDK